MGRLVNWKSVDLLLHAFHCAAQRVRIRLRIIGDGAELRNLHRLATELGIKASTRDESGGVFFTGWLSQAKCAEELRPVDCLVLPSLLECGGAVVLEAMATGKPVIATAWGGPTDYLDDSCGILVPPTGRETLIQGFADAMIRLASSEATRQQMGQNGRNKVRRHYDWEVMVDQVVELYSQQRLALNRAHIKALTSAR